MNNNQVTMTAEEMAEFQAFKAEKERKAQQAAYEQQKEEYRKLVNDTVNANFERLAKMSENLSDCKRLALEDFKTIIDMKSELFKVKDNQQSHSFINEEGTVRIIVGNYINDGYRDTVNEGISMVRECIADLAKDEESQVLVDAIMNLLAKDKSGNLNAKKVVQLVNMADKVKNPKFREGVNIIREAYTPTVSKRYIRCERRNPGEDQWTIVPLGMTEAE